MQHLAGWLLQLPAPVLCQERAWLKAQAVVERGDSDLPEPSIGHRVFCFQAKPAGTLKPPVASQLQRMLFAQRAAESAPH